MIFDKTPVHLPPSVQPGSCSTGRSPVKTLADTHFTLLHKTHHYAYRRWYPHSDIRRLRFAGLQQSLLRSIGGTARVCDDPVTVTNPSKLRGHIIFQVSPPPRFLLCCDDSARKGSTSNMRFTVNISEAENYIFSVYRSRGFLQRGKLRISSTIHDHHGFFTRPS